MQTSSYVAPGGRPPPRLEVSLGRNRFVTPGPGPGRQPVGATPAPGIHVVRLDGFCSVKDPAGNTVTGISFVLADGTYLVLLLAPGLGNPESHRIFEALFPERTDESVANAIGTPVILDVKE